MTRQETLDILNKLNNKLNSMTDEELYEHMMKTSPSFRHTIEEVDKWVEAQELKEDEIFDENGNYKYSWELKYTPTDVSTTGGRPLSEQLMDLGVIDGDTVKPTPKMDDLKSNFNNPFKPQGKWRSDNKTEVTNPDAVDNKADLKTPIELQVTVYTEDENSLIDKESTMTFNKEDLVSLLKILSDYRGLLYKETNRLLEHKSDINEISDKIDKIREVDRIIIYISNR